MTLRLPDDEVEALRAQAEREGRSMQEVIRRAIQLYIAGQDKHQKINTILDLELPRYKDALGRLGE